MSTGNECTKSAEAPLVVSGVVPRLSMKAGGRPPVGGQLRLQ